MTGYRKEKIAALFRREISELIRQNITEKYGLVTLTDIEVKSDLKDAKIFISVHLQQYEDDVLAILASKGVEFQRILGRKLKIKFSPRLHFVADKNLEKIEQIDKILQEIDHGS